MTGFTAGVFLLVTLAFVCTETGFATGLVLTELDLAAAFAAAVLAAAATGAVAATWVFLAAAVAARVVLAATVLLVTVLLAVLLAAALTAAVLAAGVFLAAAAAVVTLVATLRATALVPPAVVDAAVLRTGLPAALALDDFTAAGLAAFAVDTWGFAGFFITLAMDSTAKKIAHCCLVLRLLLRLSALDYFTDCCIGKIIQKPRLDGRESPSPRSRANTVAAGPRSARFHA